MFGSTALMRDSSHKHRPATADVPPENASTNRQRPAVEEMARVHRTTPVRMASDPSSGTIAYWKNNPLHDVAGPMSDHVVMTYPTGSQRLERRTGKSTAIGIARPGTVTVIPAGSIARWDIHQPMHSIQLYLRPDVFERIAREAGIADPGDLLERLGHDDPVISGLLLSAVDTLEGSEALDALFRMQLTDVVATRLLATHTGSPAPIAPVTGGLSPTALRRAIERLRSDVDTDVSLAALATDADLSRFHFCRAFKESTGLSPHAWLRQHRLEQAMKMLRDTDDSVVSIAAALGYSSQTAFAAAFRKLTGEPPSDWRKRRR